MNFMELYLLNRANRVSESIGSGGGVAGGFPEVVTNTTSDNMPNKPHSIPVITTGWERQNSSSLNWDSSYTGQLTTPNYGMPNSANIKMGFWQALGDKTPEYNGNSSYRPSKSKCGDNNRPSLQTMLIFGRYDTVGRTIYQTQYNGSSSSCCPGIANVMFIKNPTGSQITKTFKILGTNTYDNSYNTMAIATITPNNTSMQNTTGTSESRVAYSTSTTYNTNLSASIAFPAGKTIAVIWTNPMIYWTSFSSGAHWHGRSYAHNLSSVFDSAGLVPDHKLTAVAYQGRNNNWTQNEPWRVWKECGDIYNI